MLLPREMRGEHDGYLRRYRRGGEPRFIGVPRRVEAERKNGERIDIDIWVSEVRQREFVFFVATIHCETWLRQNKAAQVAGRKDPVTGLASAAIIVDRLEQAIARSVRSGQPIAVVNAGLDNYEEIVAVMGRGAGDASLAEVGRRVRGVLRDTDTVARAQGPEFYMLLEGLRSARDAEVVAWKIIETIREPVPVADGREAATLFSLGIAVYPDQVTDPELLMDAAAEARILAAGSGVNGYRFYTPRRA